MYSLHRDGSTKRKSLFKTISLAGAVLILLAVIVVLGAIRWYNGNLKAINEDSNERLPVSIVEGTSVADIAFELGDRSLIKSAAAFEWYVRFNDYSLQAGEFVLSPSQSVEEIVKELSQGTLKTRNVTILPGKRLDQVQASLVEQGFSEEAVAEATKASNYTSHPVYQYLPADATLEGYLFPETFTIDENTKVSEVVSDSLDQLVAALDKEILDGLDAQGLNVRDAIIIASIVEKEVSDEDDKPKVAQVFLKRIREGIQLGSDVTFFYASAVFGGPALPSLDNPYNTRLYGGLPPGPISNFSKSTLRAVAYPADTNYLFFVAGDNGTTYFNETLAGHNSDAATYCIELCKL